MVVEDSVDLGGNGDADRAGCLEGGMVVAGRTLRGFPDFIQACPESFWITMVQMLAEHAHRYFHPVHALYSNRFNCCKIVQCFEFIWILL
jgi:hypothetical protein